MKGSDIRKSAMGLFGVRDDCDKALDYAQELAQAEGMPAIVMLTAIGVYHNTLIEALARAADKGEKDE